MSAKAAQLRRYWLPQTVIGRFVARRTVRSATFVALVFAAYVAAKAEGYISAFPTVKDRAGIAASFANNIGLKALLGTPHHLETVAGFAVWNTFVIMTMIGSIWAYLTATKIFRGEEDNGRWELLLSGLTTGRRAAANALAGLASSLIILYLVTAGTFIAIGHLDKVNITTRPALFFALASVLGAVVFAALGALASQIMPTRTRAAMLCTTIFGLSFLLRASGDITSARWLLDLSPLGWIEHLNPLTGSSPLWLIPIGLFVTLLVGTTVVLAGKRDLGASILPDHQTAKPRLTLLRSTFTSSLRFTRTSTIAWLVGVVWLSAFFGLLTKTAAQAIDSSLVAEHLVSHLTHTGQDPGAQAFLGIIFFFLMTVIMCYVASAVSAMREDEAEGYLDNLLVRPIARLHWLADRIIITAIVTMIAGLLTSFVTWLSVRTLNLSVSWHSLLMAGLNTIPAAILILGIAIAAMGILPRHTGLIAYGVVAWSFLLQMLSSGLKLNHWVLDTSIFHHVALAPSVDATWGTNWRLIILGFTLVLIGALVFNRRDLATE